MYDSSEKLDGVIAMEYFPLKAGNFTSQMEINCPELGSYPYELELTATEAQYESPVNFRTVLGSHVTRNFTFFNYARQKTEYICKMDNTDFIVERSIAAAAGSGPGGTEINFDVTFEPSKLGPSTAILKASSGAGGVYKWSLHAIADSPKAQGPLTFKSGQTINLTFKNVFFQPTTFEFNIDSPHFHLARKSDTVRPRRDCRIPISYEEPNVQESNENKTKDKFQKLGKLIVSCSIPLITQTDEPKKANEIETKTNNSKKQAIQNEEEKQINYTRYEWIYYLCSNVH
ncbi:hypothetical protein A3Q56_03305 [Intoshia linei]|uniref:Hydrocephalus-inducing protein n=1 Tax=Intoshia linei TaxID=1819745 RepID=A0A177B5F5_9BILA|nr:hypothetical protein A3Q56_03305 [Intoshia linei]